MDPELERRYQLIEERAAAAEARWNRYMERVDARLDRAEARMAKYDIKFEATRKLVEGGMKLVMRNSAEIKALNKRMDDFMRASRNGRGSDGNGHGPRRKPS